MDNPQNGTTVLKGFVGYQVLLVELPGMLQESWVQRLQLRGSFASVVVARIVLFNDATLGSYLEVASLLMSPTNYSSMYA